MSIASLSPSALTGLMQQAASTEPHAASAGSGPSFGGIMDRLLHNAADSHQNAEAGLRALAVGDTDNFHSVMLQMAQADLSFRLVLEVRNRLTEAYQEIMKMQV